MPQYKYPVKNGIKWMVKFNYTDPKSGKVKTEYKRGFASKREAKKYEEDFIENLITPEETEIEPIRTFGEVFQEYLMSHKRADIKESTLETKFNIFNKHIFPTFEEKQVDTITDDDIANWQNEIKSVVQPNGKHFSESYLRTIQSQFNSIINYALNKGYMKSNPLVDIKNMGIKDKRVEFWTPEEYEKFAYYAMEYPQYYYAYEVLYWCGLRIGDADGKISLNQQKPSKHAGLRRFGPEKFLQRNNEFMKERPIFYKKPIKTEKDFSTWLRCFYYTTKAVITEYIYF